MPSVIAIPRATQREEPWANGAGSTTVILREPDSAEWRVRVSVARVDKGGPFSELPQTRRELAPLDAPMILHFQDGTALHAARMHAVRFAGSPAPFGALPEGPTRDFNLMLRGDARGEAIPRTLVDSMLLPPEPGVRWLVYLDSGFAAVAGADAPALELAAGDAALVTQVAGQRVHIEGAGEIVLVKLYA
ncbi:MAG TPA: HutD family protein [Rhodanobacteraceae bacterium]|nr:HutD family protein [Rhodanobacteraceae bacterium]